MYRIANALTPEDMQAIAARLYVDMLKGGTAHVGEFHYVHNDRDGRPYTRRGRDRRGARRRRKASGIAMTLLPAFYAHANFGGKPPTRRTATFHQ